MPSVNSRPFAITAGPGGTLWYTDIGTNRIGRITIDGVLPPNLTPNPATFTATLGEDYIGPVASFATDPNCVLVNPTVTVNWGDFTPPTPGTILTVGPKLGITTYQVSAQHHYAQSGVYPTSITIVDATGVISTTRGVATVVNSTTGPVVIVTSNSSSPMATTGQDFSGPVASFTTRPNRTLTNPVSIIDWGDHTPTTGGTILTVSPNAGVTTYQVSGEHRYAQAGAYAIRVTIVDPAGLAGGVAGLATVTDATNGSTVFVTPFPASPAAIVGEDFTGLVASFMTLTPFHFLTNPTAVIDWGDFTPSTSGTISSIPLTLGIDRAEVSGQHRYAQSGTFPIRVTIIDATGVTSTATGFATVTNPTPPINGPTVTGV